MSTRSIRLAVLVGLTLVFCTFLSAMLTVTAGSDVILAEEIGADVLNPHSDLVFRATGATRCADCHGRDRQGRMVVLDSAPVRDLIAKGKGAHGAGRFADCFRCHAGGHQGVEGY